MAAEAKKMKKFLVDLVDLSDNKKRKYIVKADSLEEAFHLAVDYHNRHKRLKGEKSAGGAK